MLSICGAALLPPYPWCNFNFQAYGRTRTFYEEDSIESYKLRFRVDHSQPFRLGFWILGGNVVRGAVSTGLIFGASDCFR